jgi:hypothetical protein
MGNVFSIKRRGGPELYLSNGGTDVFFDVMTLAAGDRARNNTEHVPSRRTAAAGASAHPCEAIARYERQPGRLAYRVETGTTDAASDGPWQVVSWPVERLRRSLAAFWYTAPGWRHEVSSLMIGARGGPISRRPATAEDFYDDHSSAAAWTGMRQRLGHNGPGSRLTKRSPRARRHAHRRRPRVHSAADFSRFGGGVCARLVRASAHLRSISVLTCPSRSPS